MVATERQQYMRHESYLVQRLNPSLGGGQMGALAEAFSFGGGLRNGGISKDAMSLLRPLFSFDYMGSAEFEFGAVPDALNRIAERAGKGRLGWTSFELDGTQLWVIADSDDLEEAERRVRSWALPHGERPRMKESTHLDGVLSGEEWVRVRGWLELDNGWFAFADRPMFEGVARLFGMDVEVTA